MLSEEIEIEGGREGKAKRERDRQTRREGEKDRQKKDEDKQVFLKTNTVR